ncbi:hypothetical protein TNIN_118471 [Trichonephila inaurata madagascariensis]|uniref:C2H2-type domain-containing protein n=1 Tax=Trichonephila inaurata madagascariensis TaxID=2747483 RepID=A0A8X6XDH0_9ARAC|nr:hypothetical protein TNIN_118471 [Trichonephila inaurata madagascariensis]
MEHKNLSNDCQRTKEIEEEEKFKYLQSFSLAKTNEPENFQTKDQPTENVEIGGYNSLNTPPRCCYNIDDNYMEHQEIDTSAFDPYTPWSDDFPFDQFNMQFMACDPNLNSTELKQNITDEILFGESAPGSIIETTSDLNIETVPWNINRPSEISDCQFGLLPISQFDLFHSKEKTSLPKETSLDSISGEECESKCENVESQFRKMTIFGSPSGNTAPRDSPTNEDSFIEAQGNGSSALDDLLQFLDNFQADQSNLPFRFTNPNSGSVEFKQNTADEILFEEAAPAWKVGTTSDIRFAMDSRNNNYVPEENFQYGEQELNVSKVGYLSEKKPTHSNKKTSQCSLCQRRFVDESRLDRHMLNHTEEKPFPCQLCENKFQHKSSLTQHMRFHTGEKLIQCDLCEKRFTKKSELKRHVRSHTGEKPFQCNICGRKFSQKSNLKTHVLRHFGDKPLQCSICKKKCASSCSLKRHIDKKNFCKEF